MKFFPYNFITRDETDIIVDSQDAQFPKENLKHPFTTKVFRTPVGTDTLGQVRVVGLGREAAFPFGETNQWGDAYTIVQVQISNNQFSAPAASV